MKIDLIGYESNGPTDWNLRVAFEHENEDSWRDELCKLAHVVPDLCVLVSYYDFRRGPVADILFKAVRPMGERMYSVPSREWLFVFGPRCVCADHSFEAFGLDPDFRLVRLGDGSELVPANWQRQ